MLPFRQLASTVTLVFLVLHTHQQLQSSGQALARPVETNATNATLSDLLAQSQAGSDYSHDDDDEVTIDSEAVLKALQILTNGMQSQQAKPSMVISHGDGGPIKPQAGNKPDDAGSIQNSKASSTNGDKQPDNKTSKKEGDKDNSSNDAAKATLQALQQPRTRFCAQPTNTNHTIDDITQTLVKKERKRLAAIRKQRETKTSSNHNKTDARSLTDAKILAEDAKTVEVVWHVIHSGSNGNLTQTMINDQISTLNSDYEAYGFAFNLSTTDRVNNPQWFKNVAPGNSQQNAMKAALRKGDEKVLNLYSVDFSNGLLGYATFPWSVQDNQGDDGVVFQYSSVPGGSETGYNLGKTVTHEVGHWLGLYHVFQGGCASPGDYVDDTPPQSVATSGCPTGQDSCKGGGVDSIHK